MLVAETVSGAIACIVDRINSVSVITPDQIETKPNIVAALPMNFVYGVGKLGDRLATIVNLQSILSSEELVSIDNSKILEKAS